MISNNFQAGLRLAAVMVMALLLSAPGAGFAQAVDLGQHARLFDIKEEDLRRRIARELLEAPNPAAALAQSADSYLNQLEPARLGVAQRTRTRWQDPSVIAKEDIEGPIHQSDGSYEWGVLVRAGTRHNPLDYVRPATNMLLVDGRSEQQLRLALDTLQATDRVKVVLTAGNPGKVSEVAGEPIFYADSAFIERFDIRATPSMIGVGEGSRSRYLAITEFSESDMTVAFVLSAWNGIAEEP